MEINVLAGSQYFSQLSHLARHGGSGGAPGEASVLALLLSAEPGHSWSCSCAAVCQRSLNSLNQLEFKPL